MSNRSLKNATQMMGRAEASCFATMGSSQSSGNRPRTRATRSRTSCAATSSSVPWMNSTLMTLPSSRLSLRICLMPAALPMASSTRWVISDSTTSALAPGYSVRMFTMMGSASGSSRTGSRLRLMAPNTMRAVLIMMVMTGRRMQISKKVEEAEAISGEMRNAQP